MRHGYAEKKLAICRINYTGFELICCNLPAKLSVIGLRTSLTFTVLP